MGGAPTPEWDPIGFDNHSQGAAAAVGHLHQSIPKLRAVKEEVFASKDMRPTATLGKANDRILRAARVIEALEVAFVVHGVAQGKCAVPELNDVTLSNLKRKHRHDMLP